MRATYGDKSVHVGRPAGFYAARMYSLDTNRRARNSLVIGGGRHVFTVYLCARECDCGGARGVIVKILDCCKYNRSRCRAELVGGFVIRRLRRRLPRLSPERWTNLRRLMCYLFFRGTGTMSRTEDEMKSSISYWFEYLCELNFRWGKYRFRELSIRNFVVFFYS